MLGNVCCQKAKLWGRHSTVLLPLGLLAVLAGCSPEMAESGGVEAAYEADAPVLPSDVADHTSLDADNDGFPQDADCDDADPHAYLWGPSGQDVTWTSQSDVDAFCASFADSCGDGTVGRLDVSGVAISHLSGLRCVREVRGALSIRDTSVVHIDRLSALQRVDGHVDLRRNAQLTTLEGFSSLTSIGGHLSLDENSALTNVDGFSSLARVGGYLHLDENGALTNVDGLASLTSVGGFLHVDENNALMNLDGLADLVSVGGHLHLAYNRSLRDVAGLHGLVSVGDGLTIQGNSNLSPEDVETLVDAIEAIDGAITVQDNGN